MPRIFDRSRYDLGVQVAQCRTVGKSSDEKQTKAEQDLRAQIDEKGGWDHSAQMGYDDTLRTDVHERAAEEAADKATESNPTEDTA